ncbi:MAG: hypothetical protein ABEJ36_02210 [Candidatus Nanosalina sp.]
MDCHELKEYFDSSDWRSVSGEFHAGLRDSVRTEIDSIEPSIDATIDPPNVCVFAPAERLETPLSHHFDSIESVSDAEVLAGMSIFLGRTFDDLVSEEMREMCFYFMNEYQEHKLTKIAGYFNYLRRNDLQSYHNYIGRCFPVENYFALNHFHRENLPEDLPDFLVPARDFLGMNGSGNVQEVVVHEMTHAYIENKAKFRKRTDTISSLDEAAAQAVSNVFDEHNVPSARYYEENIDQDVMQAARQVFLELIEDKDGQEAVSLIRRKAVEAVDKVVDGEDPIKALRDEIDRRSRIVRIASYATKRMADDVIRDLAVVGITKPYTKFADVRQGYERTKELTEVWGDLEELEKAGKSLHRLSRTGQIKEELRSPTEELSENTRKIHTLLRKDYEDEIETDISFLEDIFGDPDWTDPALYDEGELLSYMDGILYRYTNLMEEAVSRARKLESATETVHREGEVLARKYENREAMDKVKMIIQETERLHKEMDEVRQNLEEAEEMAETGLNKIEELREK